MPQPVDGPTMSPPQGPSVEPQDAKGTPQNYGKHYGEYENNLFMKGWKPGQPIHPGMQHHFDKFRTWLEDPEDRSEMRAHPGFPEHLKILKQRELQEQVSNFKPWKIETPEQFEALPQQLQQRYYKWRRSYLDRKVPHDSPEAPFAFGLGCHRSYPDCCRPSQALG